MDVVGAGVYGGFVKRDDMGKIIRGDEFLAVALFTDLPR
jgi:hypothetical protein